MILDRRPYRVRPGQPVELDDLGYPLPAGARCYVTEPDGHGATSVRIDHGTPADAVVLASDQPAQITVTNDYSPPRPPKPGPDPTLPQTGLVLLPLVPHLSSLPGPGPGRSALGQKVG